VSTAPTTAPPAPAGAAMSHRQIMEALTGLLAALFTALLSTTIVANALPQIIGDLGGTQTQYAWVITAALLANAASTPIWGKLADLYDKKLLVQLSIVTFVIGSAAAGLSPNVPFLIGARVVQGLGMGGLMALVVAIIGSIIPPRERGRYSGYMGAVMAVAMSGGPLIGGVIVDTSWLGWRWTFYVCVPLALASLVILQAKLHVASVRREGVSIDWLGALLLTAGVSLLLVWVSFAGKDAYFDWLSWQSAALVGGGVLALVLTVVVESRVAEPIIPLKIVTERTTALAIIGSIAVGVALFGSSTFLGQYFQTARGHTPTEAGLLSLPQVFGSLVGTMVSGQLITRFGRWKRFLVTGSVLMIVGLGLLATIDHLTPLWFVCIAIAFVGLGTGMLMQNLVLAVQNTVRLQDIGAASSSIAFFRTFGGAIGVSVLGSVLAGRVATLSSQGLADLGVASGSGSGSLDIAALPAPVREVVQVAYGDATGRIFLIAAVVALVTLVTVLLIREVPLRTTVDVAPAADGEDAPALAAATASHHTASHHAPETAHAETAPADAARV